MSNPYQKYKNTSIQSASREKLLLMMYEGAIKFNKMAIKAAEEKKIAERCENIGRAFDIVLELNNTLDHKVGGPIASQLEQLSMFITEQYTKSNISGDVKPLLDALKVLENLYEGWKLAIENLKKEKDKDKDKQEQVK
jgi:flagellar protein FliS